MSVLKLKHQQKARRINRIRRKLNGTADRPRLILVVSNKNVYAQIINDETAVTLASESSITEKSATSLTEKAIRVGASIAKSANAKKITAVVFDRRGRQYHGRVKAFADSARAAGLEF